MTKYHLYDANKKLLKTVESANIDSATDMLIPQLLDVDCISDHATYLDDGRWVIEDGYEELMED